LLALVKLDEERNLTTTGTGSFRVLEKEGSLTV